MNQFMGDFMRQIPTGVDGLDKMLNGGLPSGRSILVIGNPGSGKTILSLQFLCHGAAECDEPGLYVSLDEDVRHLKEELVGFSWNIDKLEKSGKLAIIDASPVRHIPGEVKIGDYRIGKRDFSLFSLLEIIKKNTEKIGAKRIVIDPLASLILQYQDVADRRNATLDLLEALAKLETTNLITTELKALTLQREVLVEEFLAHGVIVLHSWRSQYMAHGGLQIEKMRGIAHDNQVRPYKITKNGVEVFPEEEPLVDVDKTALVSEHS
jgi:KaiC/GvpD/RAD55 family RecA-like ATPase